MADSEVMNSAELTELCDLFCFWCGTERDIVVYVHVYTCTYVRTCVRIRVNCAFTYDDLFRQYGYVNSTVLRNS